MKLYFQDDNDSIFADDYADKMMLRILTDELIKENPISENASNGRGYNPNRDPDGRFGTGSGLIMSEGQLNKILIKNVDDQSWGSGEENKTLKDINKAIGYDKKPTLVDSDTFEKSGGSIYYRGVSGKNAQEYIKDFKQGELWAGNGHTGAGTYTFKNNSQYAMTYAANNPDNIIVMKLKNDSKIINHNNTFKDFVEYRQKQSSKYMKLSEKEYSNNNDEQGEYYDNLSIAYGNLDLGVYNTLRGYDAMYIGNVTVIYNRGKVIIPKEVGDE